jgi:hypothetical protein
VTTYLRYEHKVAYLGAVCHKTARGERHSLSSALVPAQDSGTAHPARLLCNFASSLEFMRHVFLPQAISRPMVHCNRSARDLMCGRGLADSTMYVHRPQDLENSQRSDPHRGPLLVHSIPTYRDLGKQWVDY